MKFLKLSPNNNYAQIGEDIRTAKWYNINEVKDILPSLKEGDEITIDSEQRSGAYYLTFLSKGIVDLPNKKESKPIETNISSQPKQVSVNTNIGSNYKGMTQDTQESIKRQAIGHMTSRTLMALQGLVNIDNVITLIDLLYDKYKEKVG